MSKFDRNIPYTTNKGYQYLIRFTRNDKGYVPVGFKVPVIGIAIETLELPDGYNDRNALNAISNIIKEYLDSNDVILYAICSETEINKSAKRAHLSNQEYRSLLFDKMFTGAKSKVYLMKNLIVDDRLSVAKKHYIHFIANIKFENEVEQLSDFSKQK